MNYNFCTLFDKNFLFKGLALYESIASNCQNFKFWILCLDDTTYSIVKKLNLKNVIPLPLGEFEDSELKKVKKTRSLVEYYWTLSSNLPSFVLKKNPNLDHITYLDADLFFYSSPQKIYEELGEDSIAIIPHRIIATRKEKEKAMGKYNVGMLIFKNDERGRACLEWWRQKCNEWCYNKVEEDRFGDQKYLDYFEQLFSGVKVIENKGADVAPWNIGDYKISRYEEKTFVDSDELIFFHFSGFKLYPYSRFLPYGPITSYGYTNWSLARKYIYKPYAMSLYRAIESIRSIDKDFIFGLTLRAGKIIVLKEFFYNGLVSPVKYMFKTILFSIKSTLKRSQLFNLIRGLYSVLRGRGIVSKLRKFSVFYGDYLKFSSLDKKDRFRSDILEINPQIYDKTANTGFDAHYIYHPAWAARVLAKTRPVEHIDISSSLTFSTMLSAFIPVRFYDYRPAKISLSGLSSGHADLLALPFESNSVTSLSCMHTIEHIGLGRYGDEVDPDGDLKAIKELKRVLAPSGDLIFVVPLGIPRIVFNAHRIYSYDQIMSYFSDLKLQEFSLIPDNARDIGSMITNATKEVADRQIYGCGLFWFKK